MTARCLILAGTRLCLTLLAMLPLALLLATSPAIAQFGTAALDQTRSFAEQERIEAYNTTIAVQPDGRLHVTEVIRAYGNGQSIKHGIFRSFPTRYGVGTTGLRGLRTSIDLEITEIKLDGRPAPWFSRPSFNGKTIYIGERGTELAPGSHSYSISYTVDHAILFGEDTDHLYWNVIGPQWDLPINSAQVLLYPPPGATPQKLYAYLGKAGAKDQAVTRVATQSGILLRANRPLGIREGLTVDLYWQAGIIPPPTGWQKARRAMADNIGVVIAYGLFLFTTLYFTIAWYWRGRDPAARPVIVAYAPPGGLSPAACRFLDQHKYDDRCFTAAIISLAIKGHIVIEQEGEPGWFSKPSFKLYRPEYPYKTPVRPSPAERALLTQLLPSPGDVLPVEKSHGRQILEASQTHKDKLERDNDILHFHDNAKIITIGWGVSAVGAVVAWLLHPGLDLLLLAPLLLLIPLNAMFTWLMRAPTLESQRMREKLEGFRRYLSVAEKDRMDFHNPPEKTLDLFEKYLPYAIALEVENRWSAQFADIITAMKAREKQLANKADAASRQHDLPHNELHWYAHDYHHVGHMLARYDFIGEALFDALQDRLRQAAPISLNLPDFEDIPDIDLGDLGSGGGHGGGSVGGGFGGGGGGGW